MVSSVVYSVHSILSNSLYLMLVELLLLNAGGVVVTLWGLSCCYLVLGQTLPIFLRFRVGLWVLLVV